MANEQQEFTWADAANPKPIIDNAVTEANLPASAKPEVADKPSFLKDVKNGLVHVAKTVWQVPAARGYLATLLVRVGVPGTLAAILVPIIDALVK